MNVRIRTDIGSDRDHWFYCAVRGRYTVDKEGLHEGSRQYYVEEGPIEIVQVRTWILTPKEETP